MSYSEQEIRDLKKIAATLRGNLIEMIPPGKVGHLGGSSSIMDITAALYFKHMNIDPANPRWADRDRFVLSKGHAAPALYAALAERGYFPREDLITLRKLDSYLQGHPNMNDTPGVDMSTGSLGQGLSAANGMALAGRLDGKDYYVYVLLGDGESQEGQVWEAAMSAAHYKLDHVIAFLDLNGLQIDGSNDEVMSLGDIAAKWRAFGWEVIELPDGNDCNEISVAITRAKATVGKPTMIICHTVKGKGVSFMENAVEWHGQAPKGELAERALADVHAL